MKILAGETVLYRYTPIVLPFDIVTRHYQEDVSDPDFSSHQWSDTKHIALIECFHQEKGNALNELVKKYIFENGPVVMAVPVGTFFRDDEGTAIWFDKAYRMVLTYNDIPVDPSLCKESSDGYVLFTYKNNTQVKSLPVFWNGIPEGCL